MLVSCAGNTGGSSWWVCCRSVVETKFPSPETTVGRLLETFPVNKYNIPIYGKMYKIVHKRTKIEGFRLVIQKMGS